MMPRVLLVDDEPLAQDLVKAILHSAGFETDIASDGFAALKLLRSHSYRIAFIDYHMPEMDGYVLAKLMRDIAGTEEPVLKLVGMTADRNGLAARRGSDALFDSIIVKPFDPHKLIDLARDAFPENDQKAHDVREAAAALLAEPGYASARSAALAFWRSRALAEHPKVFAVPKPTVSQVQDLGICFDLVSKESAELLVLMDVYGLEELSRLRGEVSGSRLPVVTLDKSLLSIADVYFEVGNSASWGDVAECLMASRSTGELTEERRRFPRDPRDAVHHDPEAFRKMIELVGHERTDDLLAKFMLMLESSFNTSCELRKEWPTLRKHAQATASVSKQLGFGRLSDTCRELVMALDQESEVERPLDRVRAAKLRSMRTLSQLRSARPIS